MNKPHKHAELIKAWADGAEIEWFDGHLGIWKRDDFPDWRESVMYRIKPEAKPDIVIYNNVLNRNCHSQTVLSYGKYSDYGVIYETNTILESLFSDNPAPRDNLKLIFDGETGELKDAQVFKSERTLNFEK